jgi:hypothetical protein
VLDDNHETILGILCDGANDKSAYSNDSELTDKEKQEILNAINKLRSDNSNATPEEWRKNLIEKYRNLHNVVKRNLSNLWPALEFELSIKNILTIKGCTLLFAGIILGPPSSLKTQVIELLRKWPHTFYTDSFSAKSFVL